MQMNLLTAILYTVVNMPVNQAKHAVRFDLA